MQSYLERSKKIKIKIRNSALLLQPLRETMHCTSTPTLCVVMGHPGQFLTGGRAVAQPLLSTQWLRAQALWSRFKLWTLVYCVT